MIKLADGSSPVVAHFLAEGELKIILKLHVFFLLLKSKHLYRSSQTGCLAHVGSLRPFTSTIQLCTYVLLL